MIRTRQAERFFNDREPTHLEAERARAATLEGMLWRMAAVVTPVAWALLWAWAALSAAPAWSAEPRAFVGGGWSVWLCSNESDCELEASRAEGVALLAGIERPITERAWWGVEAQLSAHSVHGSNRHGREHSADGNTAFLGAVHANLGYDLVTRGQWTPYVFGGVGAMAATVQPWAHPGRDDSGRDIQGAGVGLSAQAGVGARYQVSETWGVAASVRYVQPTEIEIDGHDADFARVVTAVAVYW